MIFISIIFGVLSLFFTIQNNQPNGPMKYGYDRSQALNIYIDNS